MPHDSPRPRFPKASGFAIVTAGFFVPSGTGQFAFELMTVRNGASKHHQAFTWSDFWPQFLSSTSGHWQSDIIQLVWQAAAGLALLLFWGSSQSRESRDRLESKLNALLAELRIDPTPWPARSTRRCRGTR